MPSLKQQPQVNKYDNYSAHHLCTQGDLPPIFYQAVRSAKTSSQCSDVRESVARQGTSFTALTNQLSPTSPLKSFASLQRHGDTLVVGMTEVCARTSVLVWLGTQLALSS